MMVLHNIAENGGYEQIKKPKLTNAFYTFVPYTFISQ